MQQERRSRPVFSAACGYMTSSLHRPLPFFFFNDTATTEIYTLSLHDALPIRCRCPPENCDGYRSTASPGRPTDSSPDRAFAHAASPLIPISRSGSTSVWPIVRAGLSDEYGSWNTTRRSATTRLRCLSDIEVMSSPCSLTVPAVGGCRPTTALPIVDFPEPDSPTSPRVSPGAMSKLTPSTAGGRLLALRPDP